MDWNASIFDHKEQEETVNVHASLRLQNVNLYLKFRWFTSMFPLLFLNHHVPVLISQVLLTLEVLMLRQGESEQHQHPPKTRCNSLLRYIQGRLAHLNKPHCNIIQDAECHILLEVQMECRWYMP